MSIMRKIIDITTKHFHITIVKEYSTSFWGDNKIDDHKKHFLQCET